MSDQLRETSGLVVDVDSGTAPAIPSDDEPTEAMMRMGYLRIGKYELRDLVTIGAYFCGSELLKASRGRAMVLQQRLSTLIQELTAAIVELRAKPKKTRNDLASIAHLSQAISRLSAQLTASQRLMLEVGKLSPAGDVEKPQALVRSFARGETVLPPALKKLALAGEPGARNG